MRLPPAVPVGRPRRAWWLVAVGGLGGVLFTAGLVTRVRCVVGECPGPVVRRLLGLEAVGSLPRLFTAAVFLAVAVLAGLAARRSVGGGRWWWSLVAGGAAGLAVAKAVSVHSSLEEDDGRLVTLAAGVGLSVVGLAVLFWAGRRWSVPGAVAVTAALAAYALAALGLDQVTGAVASATADRVLVAFAVYLEEGGEAVAALALLATVAQAAPRWR